MPKRYLYDKLVLALLSVLVFLATVVIVSILLRLGGGQGISEYYIEYRQGPHHSPSGDFSPTASVWSMLNFVWFTVIVTAVASVLSVKAYKIKREISVVVLLLSSLLLLLALIVSNVLLSHR